jgi:hypothetical protein
MATSSSGITEEENNYIRTFYLLLRVAPPVVRKKFDREFYPGGLKTELSTNRFTNCGNGTLDVDYLVFI